MYESLHVRVTKEQYEWLRRYCFDNKVSQAEVVRESLEMFRDKKEDKRMRTWTRNGYKVVEVEFDYDLHQFEVISDNGEIIATITPPDLDNQNEIIKALDAGEDVEGWEDGHGNTISITI
jgi:uncharacterized protein YkuJ